MAYDDINKTFFPTRTGDSAGTALERKLLDNTRGATGIISRTRLLPDGSTLRLRTRGGFPDFIRDPSEQEDVLYEYRYAYGLVDTRFSISGTGEGTSLGGPLQVLIDETGAVESAEKTILKDDSTWKDALFNDLPTNYSGMMRRVAQVLHGAYVREASAGVGLRNSKFSVDPFYFSYAVSDGLYIDTATGKRWIIEVDGTGVYRIPISFLVELPAEEGGVSWRDVENSVFADNSYEDAVNILTLYWVVETFHRADKVLIADAPSCYSDGYSTWYSWLGWAFNYSGSAATIVCLRDDPTDGSWLQTTLFDMAITAIDGVPSYVSVTSSGTSRIATVVNDSSLSGDGVFQVADTYPGVCSTVSLYRPDAPPLTAAIYSYYGPSGTKRVFHYQNYAESSALGYVNNEYDYLTPITTSGWWNGAYSSNDGCRYPADGLVSSTTTGTIGGGFGFFGTAAPTGADDKNVSTVETVRKPCGVSGWVRFSGQPPYSWKIVTGGDEDGAVYQDTLGYTGYWWLQGEARIDVTTSAHVESVVTNNAVVMSGYDREAISFASFKNNYVAEHTETDTVASCVQFSGSVVATGSPALPNFDLAIGNITNVFPPPDPPGGAIYYIAGFIDHSPTAGLGIQGSGSGMYVAPIHPGSLVSIPLGSRTVPESISTSGGWYISIGDDDIELPLLSGEVFQVYAGGQTFGYKMGASAFSGAESPFPRREFYSADVTANPTVLNIGSTVACQFLLNNFVGVF
jgi:hypothetical protein